MYVLQTMDFQQSIDEIINKINHINLFEINLGCVSVIVLLLTAALNLVNNRVYININTMQAKNLSIMQN